MKAGIRKKSPTPDNNISRDSSPEQEQKVPERKEIRKEERKRWVIAGYQDHFTMLYLQVQKQIKDSEQVWKPRVDASSVPRPERPETEEPEQEPEPRSEGPREDEVEIW